MFIYKEHIFRTLLWNIEVSSELPITASKNLRIFYKLTRMKKIHFHSHFFYLYHKITWEATLGQSGQPLNWGLSGIYLLQIMFIFSLTSLFHLHLNQTLSLRTEWHLLSVISSNCILSSKITSSCRFWYMLQSSLFPYWRYLQSITSFGYIATFHPQRWAHSWPLNLLLSIHNKKFFLV